MVQSFITALARELFLLIVFFKIMAICRNQSLSVTFEKLIKKMVENNPKSESHPCSLF